MIMPNNTTSPVENIMTSTLAKIKNLIDVNTVIGNPLNMPDGTTIIPISKVNLGFMVGGGEYSETQPKKREEYPYAGGSGGGVSLSPVGFLISRNGEYSLIKIDSTSENKWIDLLNTAIGVIGGEK